MEFGGRLRFAIRDLRRSPGYTAVAVCTLAIAIGATTAVLSVIDKVLLRPLPINEPDRVVVIWTREQLNVGAIGEFSYPAFRDWQRDVQTLESLAAIGSVNWSHSRTTLRFDDAVYTIVGVMPEGFDYPRGAELWVPLVPQLAEAGARWDVDLLVDPGIGMLFVLGRLNSGTTTDAAREDVSGLIARGVSTYNF